MGKHETCRPRSASPSQDRDPHFAPAIRRRVSARGWAGCTEFGDTTAHPFTTAFTAAPWASFTVFGAPEPRDSALIGVGAEAQILDNATLFASYDAELGGGSDNHQLWGGIRFNW